MMKLNPLERLEEKPCPVCMDWPDEHAKHCTICDGTRKIYIDYSHKNEQVEVRVRRWRDETN